MKQKCDEHRKIIFKEPLGLDAWKKVRLIDAGFTTVENCNVFDSFHCEFCLGCFTQKEIKLRSFNGAYFFKCKECK